MVHEQERHQLARRPAGRHRRRSGGLEARAAGATARLHSTTLGADTTTYKQYYTLKSTDKTDPWTDLIATRDVLENTPLDQLKPPWPTTSTSTGRCGSWPAKSPLPTTTATFLKEKWTTTCIGESETGRITPLEYDGNSCMELNFATTWSSPFYHANNVNYPLLNRLLAVPALRQRYLAHLRTIVAESLDPVTAHAAIDADGPDHLLVRRTGGKIYPCPLRPPDDLERLRHHPPQLPPEHYRNGSGGPDHRERSAFCRRRRMGTTR